MVSGHYHRQNKRRRAQVRNNNLHQNGLQLYRQRHIFRYQQQRPVGQEKRQKEELQENPHGCAKQQKRQKHNRTPCEC